MNLFIITPLNVVDIASYVISGHSVDNAVSRSASYHENPVPEQLVFPNVFLCIAWKVKTLYYVVCPVESEDSLFTISLKY